MSASIECWESGNGKYIEIDLERCTGTGDCVLACPAGVYSVVSGVVSAKNIENFIGCASCKGIFMVKAIRAHY
ncbi:MAG: 4Fe-4S dicluster domain-containing protein, partial [Candidatus Hodarchaeota archaeon]